MTDTRQSKYSIWAIMEKKKKKKKSKQEKNHFDSLLRKWPCCIWKHSPEPRECQVSTRMQVCETILIKGSPGKQSSSQDCCRASTFFPPYS